jgi:hypothetical protein
MAITDWPEDERPRERLLANGAASLSDSKDSPPPRKNLPSSNLYVIMWLLHNEPTQCTSASTTFCKWTPSG